MRMTVSLRYTILCLEFLFIQETELVTFNNHPGTRNLNENDDSVETLWTVSATCNPSNNTYNIFGTLIGTTSHTVACESCTISNNPDSGLFTMSGNTVYKSACLDTDCGNCLSCTTCSTSNGCFNGAATYNIEITCKITSYDNNDSGTSTLTVSVASETPTLTISLPGSVSANNSMSVNTVLTTAAKSSGPDIVEYTKSSAVANTYQLNTANMFELNTANGEVYVATDPSVEFDYIYVMGICIYSRRQESCQNLTINFDGCFQTANCNDQKNNGFSDQFKTVVVWLVSGVAGAFVIVVAFSLAICVWRLKRKGARDDRNDSDNTEAAQPINRIEEIELADVHHYEGMQINGDQENDAHQQVTPSHYIDTDIDRDDQVRDVDEYLHPISSDTRSERNDSNNTQTTQPNDRPDRNEEFELQDVHHYEAIQNNRDQEHLYDAHQHVRLPQNVDIVINADDQGEGEDGYLPPIRSGTAAERSDDYQNTNL